MHYEFPLMAAITLKNEYVCGGAPHNVNTVLTTANCLFLGKNGSVSVWKVKSQKLFL